MKIFFRLVLWIALAALGFWLWTIFFPNPEKVVRKKMADLAATTTISANASPLNRAGKATHLVEMFAPDAQINLHAPGLGSRTFSGRDEIRENVLGGFASVISLKVEFLDVSVRLTADKKNAEVRCTVRINGGDGKDENVQEMRFQFKKLEGTWLIVRVENVNTLS